MFLWDDDFVISKVKLCVPVSSVRAKKIHRDRPDSGFAYYESGVSRFYFSDGAVLTVREGDVIFLPQGSDYRVETVTEGICWAINFTTAVPRTAPAKIFHLRDRSGALRLFREAETAWREKKEGYGFRCLSCLYGFLAQIRGEAALGYEDRETFQKILPGVEAIRSGYSAPLSVARLAALCRITPEYFRALFKREYGVSPLKYIKNLRMERAAELLKTGLYSVGQAAEACGFDDLSAFSRGFRRWSGLSPTAFLRKNGDHS